MSNMELPDRAALLAHLTALLSAAPEGHDHGRASDVRTAVCVIDVDGYDAMFGRDPSGTMQVMGEIVRRLDRLVRSGDVLGALRPGRLALVVRISPVVAGSLSGRIEGAVAMPLEVGGELVSLSVLVGTAFAPVGRPTDTDRRVGTPRAAGRNTSAEDLMSAAERDVELQLARRSR